MQEIMQSEMEAGKPKRSCVKVEGRYFNAAALHETLAFLGEHDIVLTQVHGKKNKSFQLSAEAMDSLASAWFAFRSECKAVEEAEAVRVAEVQKKIDDILRSYIDIDIEKNYYQSVNVRILGFRQDNIRSIDALLECVTEAKREIDEYRTALALAHDLMRSHADIINVDAKETDGGKYYWIVQARHDVWRSRLHNVGTSQDLLDTIQKLIAHVQERKVQQAAAAPAPAD